MSGWNLPLADVEIGDDEIFAVSEVLRSGWLTSGSETAHFEAEFASLTGTAHALATANCTIALQLAYAALNVGPGDEVIVPSLTFVATANAATVLGAKVIFADIISEHDLTLDPADVARKLSGRTKVVAPVHYAGYPAQMRLLRDICDQTGVAIVEDCAHAPGGRHQGVPVGSWGTVGCFSFFGNKNMTTGEGGMLTTNDAVLAERLRLLRSHGMTTGTWDRYRGHASSYDVTLAGSNGRFDDVRASIGRVQLRRLAGANLQRGTLVRRYRSNLSCLAGVTMPFADRDESTFHLAVVLLPAGTDRRRVMQRMVAAGIQTSIHYPPVHQFSVYSDGLPLPVLERVAPRLLTLPLFPRMTESNVDKVVDALANALRGG
jgi:dTDP-4-amino-4,6-dideoxygalactose transaminase